MPAASDLSHRRDEIVEAVAPRLKEASFRQRQRRFLREVEAGVVQVLEFPMAPSWRAEYGRFGIAMGIYLADAAAFYGQRAAAAPGIPDCEVREPFGELGRLCHDVDWTLEKGGVVNLAAQVEQRIEEAVLPYFTTYSSRQALCAAYVSGRDPGFPPRGALTVAVLLASEGDTVTAQRMVAQFLAEDLGPGQRAWVDQRLAQSPLPLR